jgi:NAD(P)-dependent dehydrogenase (short-subunit alcohol dehydrogenase family)
VAAAPLGARQLSPVTIITGAAGGIGRAIAEALAKEGHRLLLSDIDRAGIAEVSAQLKEAGCEVEETHVDIVSPPSARAMAETALSRFGRIDALVHAAGLDAPQGEAWTLGDNHWREIIDVDLNGVWWCVQAVLPQMIKQKAGRIVMIGSVSAKVASPGTSIAYNAAKAGVNGIAIGLSTQVEAQGVRVNVIAPGPTGTGVAMSAAEREAYQRSYPLGEGGTRPVVEACLYLLGPGGDWISGSVLNVSGGRVRG